MASASLHPSIVTILERHASNDPDKPAFIFLNGSLERFVITRQQLWDYCRKFAAVLKRKGLAGKGDVVCNTLRNSPTRVITELGTITSGVISMNGQICFADGSDFIVSLNQGQCTAIILDPDDNKGAFAILKPRLESYDAESGAVVCPDVPSLKYILSYPLKGDNRKVFFKNLDTEEDMFHADISPETVCQYVCTSGSTSFFKLVAINSHALIEFGTCFANAMSIKASDVYMNNRLLGWMGGYPSIFLALGVIRVIFDESNGRPTNFTEVQWKMAYQEKCHVCFTSTVLLLEFNKVREESEDEALRSFKFRTVGSGGGPVIKSQMQASLGHLADEVVVMYASTEAGATCRLSVTDLEQFEEFNTGYPSPGIKIKIVDQDGKDSPCGEEGEILIQSTQSALYYVNNPEKTAQTFRSDGWIRLGDIGKLNSRGQLTVLGRDKFAILRGTVVLYPGIIETFIRECPGVRDVAVTGVPDEEVHEEICALVITQPGVQISVDDIKTFCVNRLANKDIVAPVPGYFLFVESFPLNVNGKLDRNAVHSLACKILNL